jgi:hypothetical protein
MAKPMQMPTRRFLFLEPRRKGSLAPIYIALLGLLALGLSGLLAVAWVPSPGPTAQRPADRPADDSRSFEGSYLPPPATPKPRHSGTWM